MDTETTGCGCRETGNQAQNGNGGCTTSSPKEGIKPVEMPEEQASCGCGGSISHTRHRPLPVSGSINDIPALSPAWSIADYFGEIMVRLDINRMDYAVEPGMYAIGVPQPDSPILVTANYKLTVDILRRDLNGEDLWLLVIDTRGVNVWCAAGKGTFGTTEVCARVMLTGLERKVTTRTLILPQLGAPGVAAHVVKLYTGFNVVYGPIRSADIKEFLHNGMKASPAMRHETFTMAERMTVAWIEVALSLRKTAWSILPIFVIGGITANGFSFSRAAGVSLIAAAIFGAAIVSGALITPLLLPVLPGRMFSVKGAFTGLIAGIILAAALSPLPAMTMPALIIFTATVSSFIAMNFTGATTFTSLSGVEKEIRLSLPVMGAGLAATILLLAVWLIHRSIS